MAKTNEELKKELQSKGINIYSISRINSFNQCEYGYKRTYIDGDRGDNNCYGVAGIAVHDWLEDIQNGKIDAKHLPSLLSVLLMSLEIDGYNFPSEKIASNWIRDMTHFANNFEPLKNEMITEQLVLQELDKGVYFQGYVDVIMKEDDGTLSVLDWKTSSEFKGAELRKAGRQLLIYKHMIESTSSQKVDKVGWYMLKYVYVTYKGKKTMLPRRNWIEKNKAKIKKEMKLAGEDEIITEFRLEECIQNNSLENLPQEVQDKFLVEPCIYWYDYTQDDIDEAIDYILTSIKEIESKVNSPETVWQPKNNGNVRNDFFCRNLCNHRETCKYLNS